MKKSAHQVWKETKEQNLTDEQTKEILVSEGIIVNYDALKRQHEIADNIANRIQKSERDWTEDFTHENGNYENTCIRCRNSFLGHKRRVVCKKCM